MGLAGRGTSRASTPPLFSTRNVERKFGCRAPLGARAKPVARPHSWIDPTARPIILRAVQQTLCCFICFFFFDFFVAVFLCETTMMVFVSMPNRRGRRRTRRRCFSSNRSVVSSPIILILFWTASSLLLLLLVVSTPAVATTTTSSRLVVHRHYPNANNATANAAAAAMIANGQHPPRTTTTTNTNYEEMIQLLDSLGLRNSCVSELRSDLPDIPVCDDTHSKRRRRRRRSRTLKGDDEENQENNASAEEATTTTTAEEEEEMADQVTMMEEEAAEEKESEWHFSWTDLILSVLCLAVSSVAAGLTVGLVSLDPLVLLIKARAGDSPEQARQAQKLLPLVKQRHLLLVTLMLLNTATSEALPVVLHDMMPELFVVMLSTLLMLFFGEIIPSAVFIGSNQLAIAASLADLVHVVMWIVYPISYPIAKLLDCVVHSEGDAVATNYTRSELAAMIRLQYEIRLAERELKQQKQQQQQGKGGGFGGSGWHTNNNNNNNGSFRNTHHDNRTTTAQTAAAAVLMRRTNSLDLDEVMIAEGALALRSRSAQDLVIGIKKVFSISYEAELTEAMIVHIFASGYSRVPVYRGKDPKQICGILMTRQLILVKASDQKKVSDLPLHSPRCIAPSMDLLELVNLFQTGGSGIVRTRRSAGHMTIVCQHPDMANEALQADGDLPIPKAAGLIGIITMEDVLEALLQEQIYDEMDAAGRMSSSMHSVNGSDTDDDSDSGSVSSSSAGGTGGANGAWKNYKRPSGPHPSPYRTLPPPPQQQPPATTTTTTIEDATSYQQIV
jgi:metal transporter CNNM